MADFTVAWMLAPVLNQRDAMSLDKMGTAWRGQASENLASLDQQKIILQSGIALTLIGDKENMRSWLRAPNFASLVARGSGTGLACTGYYSRPGLTQIKKVGKVFGKVALHPTGLADPLKRAWLHTGVENMMSGLCRIQIFQTNAIGAMRDDLVFFREGDLAMEAASFCEYVREGGFLHMQ